MLHQRAMCPHETVEDLFEASSDQPAVGGFVDRIRQEPVERGEALTRLVPGSANVSRATDGPHRRLFPWSESGHGQVLSENR
jgi:hypothetical protein